MPPCRDLPSSRGRPCVDPAGPSKPCDGHDAHVSFASLRPSVNPQTILTVAGVVSDPGLRHWGRCRLGYVAGIRVQRICPWVHGQAQAGADNVSTLDGDAKGLAIASSARELATD